MNHMVWSWTTSRVTTTTVRDHLLLSGSSASLNVNIVVMTSTGPVWLIGTAEME
jgi:hypothetical protein